MKKLDKEYLLSFYESYKDYSIDLYCYGFEKRISFEDFIDLIKLKIKEE